MTIIVWMCINLVWMSLIGVSLCSFNWVFVHMENIGVMLHLQIIFKFLRNWGQCFNWNMGDAFIFANHFWLASWVEEVCWKVRRILLWQLVVLEKSRKLNHEESQLCKVTSMSSYVHHLNCHSMQ